MDDEPDGSRVPAVRVRLGELLALRGMTVAQLSEQVGITEANLFVLKGNRARAIRLTTLAALCQALQCTPGDLLGLGDVPGPRS
jgi:putative transcriptional regulator